MRSILHLLSAVAVLGTATAADRPNILFFLVDDMGITDTSVPFLFEADGSTPIPAPLNQRYRTPHMERLAKQGRRFSNAHAYSVCTPTRASLITGQEAPRLHITTWTDPQITRDTGAIDKQGITSPRWRMEGIDPTTPTLPGILRNSGYHTIHCGKAHFGPNDTPAGDPKNLGFDVNIAGHGAGGPGSYWGQKNFSAAWRGGGHTWDVPGLEKYHGKKVFLTEALTLELSLALTKATKEGKPFFAYMAHYAVHAPFEADSRFTSNYPSLKGKDLAFATLVEGMDQSLGELLRTLEQLGVAEDTLIIFYSDNGSDGPLNRPLRGKKGTRFEGGSRVPLIAAWAKADPQNPHQKALPIPANTIDRKLVRPVDFFPTLIRIAGAKLPASTPIDGADLSAALSGTPTNPRPDSFLVHFPNGRHNNELFTTWIQGDWKLVHQYLDRSWQLFNLRDDPGEDNDLIKKHPELADKLAKQMTDHLELLDAQYPIDKASGKPIRPTLKGLR